MNTRCGRTVRLVRWMMTVVATVLLLAGPFYMAHHHHGSRLCAVVERCADDHAVNDRHTRHHGDDTPCVKQQLAAAPVKHVSDGAHFLVPLAAQAASGAFIPQPCSHELLSVEQCVAHLSLPSSFVGGHGLRAPPFCG